MPKQQLVLNQALDPRVDYWSGRSAFLSATGAPAPPFNSNSDSGGKILRFKSKTPIPEGGVFAYTAAGYLPDGKPGFMEIQIPAGQMNAGPNLPGKANFQSYDDWLAEQGPTPELKGQTTHRNVQYIGGQRFPYPFQPVELRQLLKPEQAEAQLAEINLDTAPAKVGMQLAAKRNLEYSSDDPRRVYDLVLPNGAAVSAGLKFRERSVQGIGSPGHWILGVGLTWVAEAQDTGATADEWPLPIDPGVAELYDLMESPTLMGGHGLILRLKSSPLNDVGPGANRAIDQRLDNLENAVASMMELLQKIANKE